jgi:AcrR family transcriptional regulator
MPQTSTAARDPRRSATSERRAARRQAIVDCATRLFAEVGYTDCEMDRVAAKIGVAKGTLYLYFPSKEELFYACVDNGMRQLQKAIQEAIANLPVSLDRIAKGIFAYLRYFDEHPDLVELLIQERASFKDRKRPTYFEHRDANRGPWRDLYQSLIDSGELRNDLPVERMLDTVGNLLYGTMFTNHFLNRAVPLTDQYDAVMQILLQGLQPRDRNR